MPPEILFEECISCGCKVEISLLEKHVLNCNILSERTVSGVKRKPKIEIDIHLLKKYLEDRIPSREICQLLQVSRRTLFRVLKEVNLSARGKYTEISDSNLDSYVDSLLKKNPQFGCQMFYGAALADNVVLKQKQLRASYQRVRKRDNSALMQRIHRRVYEVRAPLSLWHIDGHHKLDRYGYVIHGAIDGYSRLIVYISLENNNSSETVIGLFEKGVEKWGCPASVRSDLGGENVLVADFMINARGVNRKSFRTGKSVHNQRIERLWKDAIERCTVTFMDIFGEMELNGILDVDSDVDLFCLHFVSYDLIQRSLQSFKDAWNCHQIRTENHQSPIQLYLKGLRNLKQQQQIGEISGEIPELIQGKKLKPLNNWSSYGDSFKTSLLTKFSVDISENEVIDLENLIKPKSIQISNVKDKFVELKNLLSAD